jgi:hypothetical protein
MIVPLVVGDEVGGTDCGSSIIYQLALLLVPDLGRNLRGATAFPLFPPFLDLDTTLSS